MRVLAIENYPNTGLGLVGQALDEADAEVRIRRIHEGDPVPKSPEGYDALILLGGAQDALDDANYPSLKQEMVLARAFDADEKPVLGICLGAQILARAWGGENILGRPIEFGWHQVRATQAGRNDPMLSAIAKSAPLFHWHVDTFTLPPGAALLAESDATKVQAFRAGFATYGIQFHFEAGTEMIDKWTACFVDEIEPYAPDWFKRYPGEAEKHGAAADAAGLALARAWIGLIRPHSQEGVRSSTHSLKKLVPEPTA